MTPWSQIEKEFEKHFKYQEPCSDRASVLEQYKLFFKESLDAQRREFVEDLKRSSIYPVSEALGEYSSGYNTAVNDVALKINTLFKKWGER